ncbi:hypothetical protein DMX03_06510 [Pseudomonas koreensis]|nr:hypothetical protein DMX03_06510 [Pseudomonas koreensis]
MCLGRCEIVPALCVGMQPETLSPLQSWTAERPLRHSHAEHRNDHREACCCNSRLSSTRLGGCWRSCRPKRKDM